MRIGVGVRNTIEQVVSYNRTIDGLRQIYTVRRGGGRGLGFRGLGLGAWDSIEQTYKRTIAGLGLIYTVRRGLDGGYGFRRWGWI